MTRAWPVVSVTCHSVCIMRSRAGLPNDSLLHTLVTAQRPPLSRARDTQPGITLTRLKTSSRSSQAPEIYLRRGRLRRAVWLHLSKQWSFTGYLSSPRALSSYFTLSSPIPHCLKIGVKIPRLSSLDQQHNYLLRSPSSGRSRWGQYRPIRGQQCPGLTNQRPCIATCWHGPHLFLFISISSPSSITEECCSVLCRFIAAHYYIQMIPSLTLWRLDNNTVIIFTIHWIIH